MIFFLFVSATFAWSLLDIPGGGARRLQSPDEKLHDTIPWTMRQLSDVIIDSAEAWNKLDLGHCHSSDGRILLVELKDLCHAASGHTHLARISTDFILFGPYYDWHHVNFGPLSELGASAGANIFESRVTNKLNRCGKKLEDLWPLLGHRNLVWWIVHQHVHSSIHREFESKLRAVPIGFGYHEKRMERDQPLDEWKRSAVALLQKHKQRDIDLLISFQIHTNLFGDQGNDPRSEALRNLSATVQRFAKPEEFMDAMARSKFVLSPWGWGPDCFRSFEAIALGAIPVVISDWTTDRVLKELPHLRVNRWQDLKQMDLNAEYERITKMPMQMERLMRNFWTEKLYFVPSRALRSCRLNFVS